MAAPARRAGDLELVSSRVAEPMLSGDDYDGFRPRFLCCWLRAAHAARHLRTGGRHAAQSGKVSSGSRHAHSRDFTRNEAWRHQQEGRGLVGGAGAA